MVGIWDEKQLIKRWEGRKMVSNVEKKMKEGYEER